MSVVLRNTFYGSTQSLPQGLFGYDPATGRGWAGFRPPSGGAIEYEYFDGGEIQVTPKRPPGILFQPAPTAGILFGGVAGVGLSWLSLKDVTLNSSVYWYFGASGEMQTPNSPGGATYVPVVTNPLPSHAVTLNTSAAGRGYMAFWDISLPIPAFMYAWFDAGEFISSPAPPA